MPNDKFNSMAIDGEMAVVIHEVLQRHFLLNYFLHLTFQVVKLSLKPGKAYSALRNISLQIRARFSKIGLNWQVVVIRSFDIQTTLRNAPNCHF